MKLLVDPLLVIFLLNFASGKFDVFELKVWTENLIKYMQLA